MRKIRILAFVFLALAGCSRWDEAKERADCEKARPGDQPAVDECLKAAKLAYDQEWNRAFFFARLAR
jgi:hypothetical protein